MSTLIIAAHAAWGCAPSVEAGLFVSEGDLPPCVEVSPLGSSDDFVSLGFANSCTEPFALATFATVEPGRERSLSIGRPDEGVTEVIDVPWTLGDQTGTLVLEAFGGEMFACESSGCAIASPLGSHLGLLLALVAVVAGARRSR